MTTLLLRLAGPMQSWGVRSRFRYRDTCRFPSKSGVVGLLCAALGRSRDEPLEDLACLRMGVRIDAPGTVCEEYQITQGVLSANGTHKPGGKDTAQTWHKYLADADFLVGLEGDRETLQAIHEALRNPTWLLYLGRKSYPPGVPPWLPDGLQEKTLEEALQDYPWPEGTEQLGYVREVGGAHGGNALPDLPVSFRKGYRQYQLRYVQQTTLVKKGEE